MRVTKKLARELEQKARDFNHIALPKAGKDIIQVSAAFMVDLVERVEQLEARQCQEQKTTESR